VTLLEIDSAKTGVTQQSDAAIGVILIRVNP